MKICFTGDVFLGGDLLNNSIVDKVKLDIFNNADKRVINLEQAISDTEHIEEKCTLYTGSSSLKQLRDLKVDTVNLAHNHIQDKGVVGIVETIEHLERKGISSFGAGKNIEEARVVSWLTEDIGILGYCEFGKPYLNQIIVAGDETPGVLPLRYEQIKKDLDFIPDGKRVILYFHWGREHVYFPPYSDLEIAKKLLEHPNVLMIVGMHAHRPQGYIEHKGKRAYMCLGNFLFPNFYIVAPTQIYYPKEIVENCNTTRQYHSVESLTYKKWKWVNRVSLVLSFDTLSGKVIHNLSIQSDDSPTVNSLKGIKGFLFLLFIENLSLLYKLPKPIYLVIEFISTKITYFIWRQKIKIFFIRYWGAKIVISKIISKIWRKSGR